MAPCGPAAVWLCCREVCCAGSGRRAGRTDGHNALKAARFSRERPSLAGARAGNVPSAEPPLL